MCKKICKTQEETLRGANMISPMLLLLSDTYGASFGNFASQVFLGCSVAGCNLLLPRLSGALVNSSCGLGVVFRAMQRVSRKLYPLLLQPCH